MTRPCLKRVNNSRPPLLNPYDNPNPVTIVVSKSFSPEQGLRFHVSDRTAVRRGAVIGLFGIFDSAFLIIIRFNFFILTLRPSFSMGLLTEACWSGRSLDN